MLSALKRASSGFEARGRLFRIVPTVSFEEKVSSKGVTSWMSVLNRESVEKAASGMLQNPGGDADGMRPGGSPTTITFRIIAMNLQVEDIDL